MKENQIKAIAEEIVDGDILHIKGYELKPEVTVPIIEDAIEQLLKRYCIVEREKVVELCSLTAENSGSIDYGLIDGLTDLVCDMFNEEYHATIDNGTSMFNQNEE